jgi:hypothetical protein
MLGLGVAAVALGLVLASKAPRPVSQAAIETPAPVDTLTWRVSESGVEPALATVPKGHRVHLILVNASSRRVVPRLSGYDDRLECPPLAAGETWSGSFVADRPGADFALWIDGEPVARMTVAGSHMVEGHR